MKFSIVSAVMALVLIALFGLSSGFWIKIQNEVGGLLYLDCTVRAIGKKPEIIRRRKEEPHAMLRFFAEMDKTYSCGMCWRVGWIYGNVEYRYGSLQVYINSSSPIVETNIDLLPQIYHRWEARSYGFVHLPEDGSYDQWITSKISPLGYWCEG